MRKARALKYGVFISVIVVASLASVMYALAYTVKREVLYTETFKIEGQEQLFRAFYLSAPAVLFEATFDSVQGWECETDNGIVKWRIDPENLNQVWYLSFFNEDSYEKEVTVEVTKVWSEQNIQDWM